MKNIYWVFAQILTSLCKTNIFFTKCLNVFHCIVNVTGIFCNRPLAISIPTYSFSIHYNLTDYFILLYLIFFTITAVTQTNFDFTIEVSMWITFPGILACVFCKHIKTSKYTRLTLTSYISYAKECWHFVLYTLVFIL